MDRREAQRLRRRNQQLEEENNLLRLKVDILLDMVRGAMGRDASFSPCGRGQLESASGPGISVSTRERASRSASQERV